MEGKRDQNPATDKSALRRLSGDSIPPPDEKTRATAEGGSKKSHSTSHCRKNFGVTDSTTGRSHAKGTAAIYEQTLDWLSPNRAAVTK